MLLCGNQMLLRGVIVPLSWLTIFKVLPGQCERKFGLEDDD